MVSDLVLLPAEQGADVARLRAFVRAEHGEVGAARLEAHLRRPRYRPALTWLAERGGSIVGYALAAHGRLGLGAATLDAGYLEHVYVQPAQRRLGIFRALMGAYLGMLYEQGIPLATLGGPSALYVPLGFAPFLLRSRLTLPAESAAETGSAASPHAAPALRAAAEDDLDDLAALYESCYAQLPLADHRAPPDWRDWLAGEGSALVLRDARGRTAAYALLAPHRSPGHPLVAEAAAADASAGQALLHALLGHIGARGAATLELALPPEHPLARVALQRGAELRLTAPARGPQETAALAGVVDVPGALQALAPELERRLALSRYAGWDGAVRIELDAGRATVLFERGRPAVVDGTRPADVRLRRVALPALAQLLLGYRTAGELRAAGGLECDDTALGLVHAIFPPTGACGE